MLESLIYVSLGAVAGGIARFVITHYSSELSGAHGFPYGTLVVNIVGCFLVGYILTWSADHDHDRWRLLMATGFCGAFTTFSAFAYESMAYWHQGKFGYFLLNLMMTNVFCMAGVTFGIWFHNFN